jgi:NADH-quinone oxidoreductase subunit C
MLNSIVTLINNKLPNAGAKALTPEAGDASLLVNKDAIHDVIALLKNNEEYSFNSLEVISGVDYPEYFEVNYMLTNFDENAPRDLIVKAHITDKQNPTIDTICDLYLAANFQERECFDMLGIIFNNHPDPRRILCPDDWEGYPLRKDYVVQEVYRGMVVNPESKMNLEDRGLASNKTQST